VETPIRARLRLTGLHEGRSAGRVIERLLEVSRSHVQKLFRKQRVELDGSPLAGPASKLPGHGLLTIRGAVEGERGRRQLPANRRRRLKLLYRDEHMLAVEKPAGLVMAPGPGHGSDTFLSILLGMEPGVAEFGEAEEWGMVHRLDRDTSGVLLAALTLEARRGLKEAFRERKVEKRYLALCSGELPEESGRISESLRMPDRVRRRSICDPSGVEAITDFEVRERLGPHLLLSLRPLTGRTHQLRVHLESIGIAILGDALYGVRSPLANRQLLHAEAIAFEHPVTKERIALECPPPKDFRRALKRARKRYGPGAKAAAEGDSSAAADQDA